jgi:transcriptional regulator with GAF, ATPase, and Fis domain
LQHIPAEIGLFDRDGRFLFNTPSGIADAETRRWVIGKTHHDYCRRRGYPMAIADERQVLIERCVQEKIPVTVEEQWIDKSNQPRLYVRTFCPVLDDSGEATHVIGYGQEITELKRAEADLRVALAAVEELRDRLEEECTYLQEEIKTHHDFDEIVGESEALKSVLTAIETVAPTGANVVVTGETGTGKELVARAVHARSPRAGKPLIKVNCASIPRELFESEFFGHVKGAFTGAMKDRAGRFQLAHEGTLFLDEVGEIPLAMQSKLLRVLQEGEYERVGDERTRRVDVRIIAATNRDLKDEVADGRFRQDLYYRLNVFPIEVPPLRDRGGDIALLARRFLRQLARELGRPLPRLTNDVLTRLRNYDWPGNVRELRNVLERGMITSPLGTLRLDMPARARTSATAMREIRASNEELPPVVPEAEMRLRERDNLAAALLESRGKIYGPGGAAELLDIKPTTLAYRIKKLGLEGKRIQLP